jgi:hypothetical protein
VLGIACLHHQHHVALQHSSPAAGLDERQRRQGQVEAHLQGKSCCLAAIASGDMLAILDPGIFIVFQMYAWPASLHLPRAGRP